MLGSYTQSVGAPNGATGTFGPTVDVVVTSHASLAVGDCVMLPVPNSYNTTTGEVGWTTSASTAQPTTAGFTPETRQVFGIVMTAVGSSKPVRVRLRGACQALTVASAAAGKPLVPTNSSFVLSGAAAATNSGVITGVNLVLVGGSNALSPCMFDGLYGFGSVSDT